MALLELRNVTKRYHKGGETITPLDDISLDVEDGEFISLMGASGTGKSTLLNLIAGIDRPDAGSILIDGAELTRLMVQYKVGVRVERTIELCKLDLDYFEEEGAAE